MTAPGWYPDPNGSASYRWWNGTTWTHDVSPASAPPASDQTRTLSLIAIWALLIIGAGMALFTSVSLLSGTSTVWIGVALTIVGAVVAFVVRQVGTATRVVAVVIAVACAANGIYDEVQLQHKRDQLTNVFDN